MSFWLTVIHKLRMAQLLSHCSKPVILVFSGDRTPSLEVVLPETVFLASFAEAFPAVPKSLHLVDGIVCDGENQVFLFSNNY